MTTPPRPGLAGAYDLLVGPGATPLEEAGAWLSASVGAIAGGLLPSSMRERALGVVLGFDAGGGLWVNESAAGKQWYRRAEAPAWEPAGFAALHVHPFLVEAVSGRRSWGRAAVAWALPVAASAVVAVTPLARQRVAGGALAAGTAVVGAAMAPSGWRWLAPVLAAKLVLGHATPSGRLARMLSRPSARQD